jgi:hypothetical protein
MKKLFFLIIISALIIGNHTGCNNSVKKEADSTKLVLTVDTFLASPEKWANKDVVISGTVSHVCRNSGKKLFLFTANPDNTVKINTGGDFSSFDIKLEGTDVEITGTVVEDEKIDANYLNEWESDIKKMVADKDQKVCIEENKAISGQTADKTKVKEVTDDPYADVKEFRQKLEKSGKTYISIYAINIKTLKEVKKK